ncbi:hypothetical protein [Ekhidna sp.]|uniref:hypothetical protein n=1 Tax=Ekhidna sp. TaxID=2608089 RepID=UPI003B5A5115
MVKKLCICVLTGFLMGCGSSGNESTGSSEMNSSPVLQEKTEGSYIPEEVMSNLAGKRRSKLSNLYSDGPSWFSFRIEEPFRELNINLVGKKLSYKMAWDTEADSDSDNPLPLSNMNQGDFMVDVVLTPGQVQVFFNEGMESFLFNVDSEKIDARVEVYLDGEYRDLPGVLYDIGV